MQVNTNNFQGVMKKQQLSLMRWNRAEQDFTVTTTVKYVETHLKS